MGSSWHSSSVITLTNRGRECGLLQGWRVAQQGVRTMAELPTYDPATKISGKDVLPICAAIVGFFVAASIINPHHGSKGRYLAEHRIAKLHPGVVPAEYMKDL